MARLALSNGQTSLIDDDVVDQVAPFRWNVTPNGYAVRHATVDGKKVAILLHRVVANPKAGEDVDHANRDRLDNRRANLRNCSHRLNIANQRGHSGRSGPFKGVARATASGRFRARITVNCVSVHLGCFESAEDAARAYDAAAVREFGRFASINFPTAAEATL